MYITAFRSKLMCLFLASGIVACNSSSYDEESISTDTSKSNSIELTEINDPEGDQEWTIECTRARAEPIIKKEYYPNSTFDLQADSLTAIEKVQFDNGDKLTIKNWGCEYYDLTFIFETTNFQRDTADLRFWYQASMQLVTSMLAAIDAPIDIKRGLAFLESYYLADEKNNFQNLKLGEELDFGQSIIRSFVVLDRIELINNNEYGVTISFVKGPL